MAKVIGERSGCTEARFLEDVKDHRMEIIRNDGEYRHVRFKRQNSTAYTFDLITWPGHLCYTGDMGTYVFSRIRDMFQFFRADPKTSREVRRLHVNHPYWAEKVLAMDKNGVIEEFVPELARRQALEILRELAREVRWSKEAREKRREIYDEVCQSLDGPEHEVRRVLYEHFDDSWEWRLMDYTYTYRWACFAIAWGIAEYDRAQPAHHMATVEKSKEVT